MSDDEKSQHKLTIREVGTSSEFQFFLDEYADGHREYCARLTHLPFPLADVTASGWLSEKDWRILSTYQPVKDLPAGYERWMGSPWANAGSLECEGSTRRLRNVDWFVLGRRTELGAIRSRINKVRILILSDLLEAFS